MKYDYTELITRLQKRFDDCYEDYMDEIMSLCKGQIFELASEIAATKEVYVEMCFWLEVSKCDFGENDMIALLAMEDPLKELAGKWWFYTIGNKVDFQEFFKNKEGWFCAEK